MPFRAIFCFIFHEIFSERHWSGALRSFGFFANFSKIGDISSLRHVHIFVYEITKFLVNLRYHAYCIFVNEIKFRPILLFFSRRNESFQFRCKLFKRHMYHTIIRHIHNFQIQGEERSIFGRHSWLYFE